MIVLGVVEDDTSIRSELGWSVHSGVTADHRSWSSSAPCSFRPQVAFVTKGVEFDPTAIRVDEARNAIRGPRPSQAMTGPPNDRRRWANDFSSLRLLAWRLSS